MFGGTENVANRVLEAVATSEGGMTVVMLGSTEKGCGGYGRPVVDSWAIIEVRMFGWPMLVPGDEQERPGASAAMRRSGLGFNGADWVWRRPFLAQLVPVAAQRPLARWRMRGGSATARQTNSSTYDGSISKMLPCSRRA